VLEVAKVQAAEEAGQDQDGAGQRAAAYANLLVGIAASWTLTLTLLLRESLIVRGVQGHQRSLSTRQRTTERRWTSSQQQTPHCTAGEICYVRRPERSQHIAMQARNTFHTLKWAHKAPGKTTTTQPRLLQSCTAIHRGNKSVRQLPS